MSERLIVQDFAGITSVELDLRQINVLIGPQATGKSICAKLLFFFKTFINEMFKSIEKQHSKHDFDTTLLKKFEKYFPPQSLSQSAFSIRYELGDVFIAVDRGEDMKPHLSYSDEFDKQRQYAEKRLKSILKRSADEEGHRQPRFSHQARQEFLDSVSEGIGPVATYYQLFIPAGRSFFAYLQERIFSILSANGQTQTDASLDPFVIEFGALYEGMKNYLDFVDMGKKEAEELRTQIDRLIEMILCGKHKRERGKDFLESPDGRRRTSLANASSGQQETLPLAIILKAVGDGVYRGKQSMYIEEPEAHLFPTGQRHIVELMATVFNSSQLQFIVTTHSPYILTAFNNLLEAGSLAPKLQGPRRKKLHRIVPPEQILEPKDFRAYSLDEGTAKCICDRTGLITTNVIDEVSNALSEQFGDLLEIDE